MVEEGAGASVENSRDKERSVDVLRVECCAPDHSPIHCFSPSLGSALFDPCTTCHVPYTINAGVSLSVSPLVSTIGPRPG